MIANGGAVKTNGVKTTAKGNVVGAIKSLPSRIKALHVVAVIGLFSILLGYISIAPPSDLPNWPLYRLNSKVWQSFERSGQHVKPYHV